MTLQDYCASYRSSKLYNDKWALQNVLSNDESVCYFAVIHDDNGDYVYHSVAPKGKNQWLFDTESALKISITGSLSLNGNITLKMINDGFIEIKKMLIKKTML